MWRDHYEELLNSSANSHEKEDLLEHFKSVSSHVGMQVTMLEVLQIVKDLPNAKSSGLDGLNGESLKYAHPLLCLLLSIGNDNDNDNEMTMKTILLNIKTVCSVYII